MSIWVKKVGRNLQVQLSYEMLRFLQQTRQEAMHVFALMALKSSNHSYVQNLVEKLAMSPPRGTIGHEPKKPLRHPRPGRKDQRSREKLAGM